MSGLDSSCHPPRIRVLFFGLRDASLPGFPPSTLKEIAKKFNESKVCVVVVLPWLLCTVLLLLWAIIIVAAVAASLPKIAKVVSRFCFPNRQELLNDNMCTNFPPGSTIEPRPSDRLLKLTTVMVM